MPPLGNVGERAAVADHRIELSIREQGQVRDIRGHEGIDRLQQSRFSNLLLGDLKLTLRQVEGRDSRP